VPGSHPSQAVSAELEKIVAHPLFAAAPSLVRFLRYVVEETLAGHSHLLKEYSIGRAVFGRGEEYSPRIDPIVRVQARNLRARLERYYAGPGASDRVRIELPKGTYVPLFQERARPWRAPKRLVSAVLAAAAALLLVGVAMMELHRAQHHEPGKARPMLAP